MRIVKGSLKQGFIDPVTEALLQRLFLAGGNAVADTQARHGPVAVRFDSVDFSYERIPVLSNVSFHIHQNEFAALVGSNGSGKTTLLKLLLGLEKPVAGRIVLFEDAAGKGRERIGYVPQNAGFDPTFPVTVRSVVRMGRLRPSSRFFGKEDAEAVNEAMEKADIADLAERPYSALSGGQRRRVLVARALASRPSLLVLDEPAANMDSESEKRLFDTLGQLKGSTTILIVTHDTAFVSSLTDVAFCVAGGVSGCSIVRHRTEPAADAPHDLYGGSASRVRHDIDVPDSWCCEEGNPL